MTAPRSSRLAAFVRARLSPQDYLGLHLSVGALVLMLAVFVFAQIAEGVMLAQRITRLDVQVSNWFHANATPLGTQLMLGVTHLHSTAGILGLCAALALYWRRRKAWDWGVTLLVSVPLGMLINVALKDIFQRARPSFEHPVLTLASYSFPSGHTAGATLFYGVLAAWLICRAHSWFARIGIALLASLMVALVALSRVYLGAHYPSDVLAAMAAGGGWLAFSLTAAATWRRRRRMLQRAEAASP
jgi:membrane-associated phospholipid phosphatase